MQCPICQNKSCDELIVDLLICNKCSHIFKKEPHFPIKVVNFNNIHELADPIKTIQAMVEHQKEFTFEFYSLMFNILELQPNQFYKYTINHYFNQMSLMILLKRCGLIPIEQINSVNGKWCLTKLKVKRG